MEFDFVFAAGLPLSAAPASRSGSAGGMAAATASRHRRHGKGTFVYGRLYTDIVMSRSIDRSEAIAFFDALRRRESSLVFWSFDTSNGQERLIEGYVNDVNLAFLEIEPRNGDTVFVVIAGVDFVRLDRDEAPHQITAVALDSYDFVLGFSAGKYAICIMATNPKDGTPPTPPALPSTPEGTTPS